MFFDDLPFILFPYFKLFDFPGYVVVVSTFYITKSMHPFISNIMSYISDS